MEKIIVRTALLGLAVAVCAPFFPLLAMAIPFLMAALLPVCAVAVAGVVRVAVCAFLPNRRIPR